MAVYDAATEVCAGQLHDQPLPSESLFSFQAGGDVDIVYLTDHGMSLVSGQEVSEEVWFTRREQNVPYMKNAVSELDYQGKTQGQVATMVELRMSAALGMQSQGPNAKINIGKTAVKQMDPSASDKSGGFFRPCWNSVDITSTRCHYAADGPAYTRDHAASSFKLHTPDEFPFVGLGWTFDWMNWLHEDRAVDAAVGLNEFVILPHRGTVVTWTEEMSPLQYVCHICADGDCGTFSEWAREGCAHNPLVV